MASVAALVTPELMKWARETMGLRLDEAAKKIGRSAEEIQGWEDGTRRPTMAQLRKASEVYKRPLAVFFLPEPPRDFIESDADIIREAADVLMNHLTPSQFARFWAMWQAGHGDYLHWRDETFAGRTMEEPVAEIRAFEEMDTHATNPDLSR